MSKIYIHKTSIIDEPVEIGSGTKIYHHSHIRENVKIGQNVNIGKNVYIDKGVVIGDNCKIQNNVSIYTGVNVGNNVFIGPSVTFTNDLYPSVNEWTEEKIIKTTIEDNVSLGANSTIICGIILGNNCLIGAGSVVTKSINPGMIAYGNPASEIKKRI